MTRCNQRKLPCPVCEPISMPEQNIIWTTCGHVCTVRRGVLMHVALRRTHALPKVSVAAEARMRAGKGQGSNGCVQTLHSILHL